HGLQEVLPRGFNIVHHCNMPKLWPGGQVKISKNGKILKPAYFKRPEKKLKHLLKNISEI
ncbi:MAG: hypothetical protein V3W20_10490, partial [Candidatus Neomarinimicrobiota bacterium]